MTDKKRFFLINNETDVSVLDTGHELVEEEGNAELFGVFPLTPEDAKFMEMELDTIVRLLNEQHNEIIKLRDENEKLKSECEYWKKLIKVSVE